MIEAYRRLDRTVLAKVVEDRMNRSPDQDASVSAIATAALRGSRT
jgi:hypothetical protein